MKNDTLLVIEALQSHLLHIMRNGCGVQKRNEVADLLEAFRIQQKTVYTFDDACIPGFPSPIKELKSLYPLVLYFPTEADAQKLLKALREVKPGLIERRL